MQVKVKGSHLISTLIIITLIWVFSRPLGSIGLHAYEISGKYLSTVYKNLLSTQEDATDLLATQRKLKSFKDENRLLKLENSKLKSKAFESENLERQLKYKSLISFDTIPALIIGRSPDTWHKQIIINKGSVNGVRESKAVLTEKGIVGQVTRTTSNNSVAQLIFDKNFRLGAKLLRSDLFGVLVGSYPDPARLDFITVGSDVKVGDKVVSSGISINKKDPIYPKNYPIGEVVEIERSPDALDLIVKVKLYEDLRSLKEVFVLN